MRWCRKTALIFAERSLSLIHIEMCIRDRIAGLWRAFLENGVSYEEFERFLELLQDGEETDVYSWEFALGLALEACGFEAVLDETGFMIVDAQGKRRIFDFENGPAAERLLMKFLFPA